MTNTGDFRRYSYSSDASYALDAFNLRRSSAAPDYSPDREYLPKRELKVHENKKRKSRSQLLKEQKSAAVKTGIILVVALGAIAMFFGMLNTNARKNELNHEISKLNNQLSIAESENTRINSELNALVSMDMIDKYAVEKLGMSKMQPGQINYINVSQFKENYKSPAQKLLEQKDGR